MTEPRTDSPDPSTSPEPPKKRRGGTPRLTGKAITAYEERRRRLVRERSMERVAASNSLGKIPKCKNPKRRREAEKTLRAWIETYLLTLFSNPKTHEHYPFSKSQVEAMDLAERAIREGGNLGIALRRGGFKTGLCKAAILFGAFLGLQGWTCIIAATDDKAAKILESLKTVLEMSRLLHEDYPEACLAFRALQNQSNRSKRQTYTHGKVERSTRVSWNNDRIVFPDVVGAKCRQAVITSIGLTASGIRGQLMTTGELIDRRPTCLLFDDIETDESAASDLQTPQRMRLFETAMEMGGPGVPLAAFYAGTIIAGDSVCSRVLALPGWNSVLRPAMPKLPLHCSDTPPDIEHEDLWGQYGELLRIKDPDRARKESTEFYRSNRALMDEGAVVDWEYAKDPHHLSAIQFCMDKFLLKPDVFWAEYQQAPRTSADFSLRVTPAQIMSRCNGYPRGQVPSDSVIVTCGVDVHKEILYYVVVAWAADFTGHVIDYGTWPDQGRRVFLQSNPPHPLRLDYAGTTLDADGILQAGLVALFSKLKSTVYPIVAGQMQDRQIGKLLVDGRYGTRLVFAALRKVGWGMTAEVAMGIGDEPGKKPISMRDKEKARKDGEVIGDNWYKPQVKGTQEAPHINIGVNHWKSGVHNSFAQLPGTRGALQIFGSPREAIQHDLFAHQVGQSETPKIMPMDRFGRIVTIWKLIPGGSDPHLFDALVYAMSAASVSGQCHPPVEGKPASKVSKHRYRTAEQMAGAA